MSKQLLINDRPSDNAGASSGGGYGGAAAADWPKASIGNYKGVMLCNRPNEMGQQQKASGDTSNVFNSRVLHLEPLGWNPVKKFIQGTSKRRGT